MGQEGSFRGGAAVMSPDGDVVDSGEGPSCPGCVWDLSRTCYLGGAGTCQEQAGCVDSDTGESTKQLWTVWLTTPETPRREAGTICLGDQDDLVTTADVGEQVQDAWLEYVPAQRPSVQPPDGRTLVNLPTYFHSGQPAQMPATTIPVLDFHIQLTARAQWEWTFEPGVTKTFDTPGSHWDDPEPREVQYTYDETGDHLVTLNTTWWGSFRVGDYGPYDIETPATQGPYQLDLEVTEAKSVLTR